MSANSLSCLKDKIVKKNRILSRFALMFLMMSFLVVLLGSRMFVIIRPGQMGVIWSFFYGTDKDTVLSEGLNIISPLNNVYIYDTRISSIDKAYNLQSKEGLDIQINVNIRVRPDIRALPSLHQTIGPDFINKIVIPQIESVVRRIAGHYTIEEIYTSSKGLNETIVVASNEALQSRYIYVDRVLIKSMVLPETIRQAIENKIVLEQENNSYKYKIEIAKQEARRQIIEAEGINSAQKIVGQSLSNDLLRWHGIVATKDLSKSSNAKTVIYGAGKDGLPLIMNDKQ